MVLITHTTGLTVRRSSQASVGLFILGLHMAGMLAWWTTGRYNMRMVHLDRRLPTISVWLTALPVPNREQARKPERAQDRTATAGQRDTKVPAEPGYMTDTATAPTASGMPLPIEASGPTEAPTSGVPTLNLNLSRKDISSAAPRSFAEQSPFRGRLPKTVERQIANAAAQTGPWTEERLDNDRIRFRRGNTCVTMQRPRAASIDPFSEAAGRIPWRSSQPEECTD